MFLPYPEEPIRHLPRVTVYHYYPMDTKMEKEVVDKDARGNSYKRKQSEYVVAYMNIVMPQRDADAYRRARSHITDFGMNYIVDLESSRVHFHNFYGMDKVGVRALTNVIIWHNTVYDGTNPEVARVVIGDESVLVNAMEAMLKYYTDVPFLPSHVAGIVRRAREMGCGAVQFKGSHEWATPVWYLTKGKSLWNKILLDYFKK